MKKKIYNIFGLRCLMMAVLAALCGTSWADDGVSGSPLAPWWDSTANGGNGAYVLRTIDDDNTVIDAMKALQEVNSTTDGWSNYKDYSFYLVEDVDFDNYKDDSDAKLNWVPLGTASNPFKSNFYCYTPTWDFFNGPTSSDNLKICPKQTASSPAACPEEWKDLEIYTFSFDDLKESEYNRRYESPGSNSYTLKVQDMDVYIQSYLSSYAVKKDYNHVYVTMTTSEYNRLRNTGNLLEGVTAKEDKAVDYRPIVGSGLGYYYDEDKKEVYYSTDGHIGTCKISNMTVSGEYADGAGFFGTVDSSAGLYGFTFVNCSVENTSDEGYAGVLYGTCSSATGEPKVKDIFIGNSTARCNITAYCPGGVYGQNTSGDDTELGVYKGLSSLTFDPVLEEYSADNHTGAIDSEGNSINKVYISITGEGNYVSATNKSGGSYTYVNGTVKDASHAFGKNEEGEYGDGTEENPFIISSVEHVKNLIALYQNYGEVLTTFDDLKETFDFSKADYEEITDEETDGVTKTWYFCDASDTEYASYTLNPDNTEEWSFYMMPGIFYFKQTEDITFVDSDYDDDDDDDTTALPAGIGSENYKYSDYSAAFDGTYDGGIYSETEVDEEGNPVCTGRHTINVNIATDSENDYCALFAYTNGATIKNLNIVGTNTAENTNANCGGIIAYDDNNKSKITNCIVSVDLPDDTETETYINTHGLVGSGKPTITDSFNKAERDLDMVYCDPGTTVTNCSFTGLDNVGDGTKNHPLMISSLEGLKILSDCGLYYQLVGNLFDQTDKLVDLYGTATLPSTATDNDAYIPEFCGTIIGDASTLSDSSGDKFSSHIIAGITDKTLFGTIVGPTEISNIGFVNCYNKDNKNVKLAGSIASGASLTLEECYSDTYFIFGSGATKKNSYEYGGMISDDTYDVTYYDGEGEEMAVSPNVDDVWVREALTYETSNYRLVLKNTSIPLTDSKNDDAPKYYTDAIATKPLTSKLNVLDYKECNSTDGRAMYKYNIASNGNKVYNLILQDITAEEVTDESKDIDATILATDFKNNIGASYVYNAYYKREIHNDWESVCLPFAYSLSDVVGYGEHFTAYKFKSYDESATFEKMDDDAEISAGQPVLFKADKNAAFIVKLENNVVSGTTTNSLVEDPSTITNDNYFYGALQTVGNEGSPTITLENIASVYKISGTANGTGGTLLLCNKHSWIYPFRTYLDFSGNGGSGSAKSIIFSISDNQPCDVNGDASVNIADVNAVIGAMCVGSSSKIYDINKDGVINIADVNAIISTMCGK